MNMLEKMRSLREGDSYKIKVYNDNIIDDLKDYIKIFNSVKNESELKRYVNELKKSLDSTLNQTKRYGVESLREGSLSKDSKKVNNINKWKVIQDKPELIQWTKYGMPDKDLTIEYSKNRNKWVVMFDNGSGTRELMLWNTRDKAIDYAYKFLKATKESLSPLDSLYESVSTKTKKIVTPNKDDMVKISKMIKFPSSEFAIIDSKKNSNNKIGGFEHTIVVSDRVWTVIKGQLRAINIPFQTTKESLSNF